MTMSVSGGIYRRNIINSTVPPPTSAPSSGRINGAFSSDPRLSLLLALSSQASVRAQRGMLFSLNYHVSSDGIPPLFCLRLWDSRTDPFPVWRVDLSFISFQRFGMGILGGRKKERDADFIQRQIKHALWGW
jgi:hypothetical protein